MKGCPTSNLPFHVPHRHDRDIFDTVRVDDLPGIHSLNDRKCSLHQSDALAQQRRIPLEGFMDFPALLSSLEDIRVPGPVIFEQDCHPVGSGKGLEVVVMNLK